MMTTYNILSDFSCLQQHVYSFYDGTDAPPPQRLAFQPFVQAIDATGVRPSRKMLLTYVENADTNDVLRFAFHGHKKGHKYHWSTSPMLRLLRHAIRHDEWDVVDQLFPLIEPTSIPLFINAISINVFEKIPQWFQNPQYPHLNTHIDTHLSLIQDDKAIAHLCLHAYDAIIDRIKMTRNLFLAMVNLTLSQRPWQLQNIQTCLKVERQYSFNVQHPSFKKWHILHALMNGDTLPPDTRNEDIAAMQMVKNSLSNMVMSWEDIIRYFIIHEHLPFMHEQCTTIAEEWRKVTPFEIQHAWQNMLINLGMILNWHDNIDAHMLMGMTGVNFSRKNSIRAFLKKNYSLTQSPKAINEHVLKRYEFMRNIESSRQMQRTILLDEIIKFYPLITLPTTTEMVLL